RPVRMVSDACAAPIDITTTSLALPASFRRRASSTAISSNGFIDILTLLSSTPEPSLLTRTLTLKSTTRFTGTRTFIDPLSLEFWGLIGLVLARYRLGAEPKGPDISGQRAKAKNQPRTRVP